MEMFLKYFSCFIREQHNYFVIVSFLGRLFGKRLTDLSKLLVSLDGHTDVVVPKFVVSACTYIEVGRRFLFFSSICLIFGRLFRNNHVNRCG